MLGALQWLFWEQLFRFCLPAEALRKVCVMWPRDNYNRELLRGLDDRN